MIYILPYSSIGYLFAKIILQFIAANFFVAIFFRDFFIYSLIFFFQIFLYRSARTGAQDFVQEQSLVQETFWVGPIASALTEEVVFNKRFNAKN